MYSRAHAAAAEEDQNSNATSVRVTPTLPYQSPHCYLVFFKVSAYNYDINKDNKVHCFITVFIARCYA